MEVKGWVGKVYLISDRFLKYRLMQWFSNRETAGKELKLCLALPQGIASRSWENTTVKVRVIHAVLRC